MSTTCAKLAVRFACIILYSHITERITVITAFRCWFGVAPGNADDNDGDGVFVLIMTARVPHTTMGPQHVRVLVYDRDGRPLSTPCYEHHVPRVSAQHFSTHSYYLRSAKRAPAIGLTFHNIQRNTLTCVCA